jgi:hypothetical protein
MQQWCEMIATLSLVPERTESLWHRSATASKKCKKDHLLLGLCRHSARKSTTEGVSIDM